MEKNPNQRKRRGPYGKRKFYEAENLPESVILSQSSKSTDEQTIDMSDMENEDGIYPAFSSTSHSIPCSLKSTPKRCKQMPTSTNSGFLEKRVFGATPEDSNQQNEFEMDHRISFQDSDEENFLDTTGSEFDSISVQEDLYEAIFADSDFEVEEENLEENCQHQNDEDQDKDLLYQGANVSVGAVMLLLALFVTKHSLVGDGIQQLLHIFDLVLPQGHKLCNSVHAFKMFFKQLKNPLVKHFYCGYCLGYINDSSLNECPYTKCKRTLGHKMEYFLEMPVKNQLKKLFAQTEFYSNLQHRFKPRRDGYHDIYDGDLYKSYCHANGPLSNPDNISFTFNTDGASVFKSSNVSVWPLFLVINELPYTLRMKKENMILAGLWFGSKKPLMDTYLKPFLESFTELNNGIEIDSPDKPDSFILKAFLLCGTADLPARSILCNSIQYNGSFSCWKCIQKGETAKKGKGHTHVFPFDCNQPKQPFRTKDSVIQDAHKAIELPYTTGKLLLTHGVKGPSWLTFFPKFEIVHGIAIDYMHGVLLGVQKLLLNLWFSATYKDKEFNFFNSLSTVDDRILNIKPTSHVSRLPRSIAHDLKYWKASEFRSFLLFFGAPILNGILDDQRFAHYVLLVNAVYILLKSGSTEQDLAQAEKMLFTFVEMFGDLYDISFMTLNIHQLLHLPDSVRSLGPLYTHSCFPFEDKNGILLKMIRGTQNIDNQIITGVSFLQKLPELKQSTIQKGSRLEDLYNSIENPNILKRGMKLSSKEIYVLGAIKKRKLTDSEHKSICQCLGYDPLLEEYKYFKRLEYYGSLIYGTSYSRMVKRDNSTVLYCNNTVEMFGKVLFFLLLETLNGFSGFAIIEELVCKNFTSDSNILAVEKLNSIKAIPIESILGSCIHIILHDKPNVSFVCKIPNNMESD